MIVAALQARVAIGHVDIAGELRVGSGLTAIRASNQVLGLPRLAALDPLDAMSLMDDVRMNGRGVGWTDASIILACKAVGQRIALHTRDRRMAVAAKDVGVLVLETPGN